MWLYHSEYSPPQTVLFTTLHVYDGITMEPRIHLRLPERVMRYFVLAIVLVGTVGEAWYAWKHHQEEQAKADITIRQFAADQLQQDLISGRMADISDRKQLPNSYGEPLIGDMLKSMQALSEAIAKGNIVSFEKELILKNTVSPVAKKSLSESELIRMKADVAERLAKARKMYEESTLVAK